MPGFMPDDSIIHPSPSTNSLTSLSPPERPVSADSPSLPRKTVLPANMVAREGFLRLHMAARENDYIDVTQYKYVTVTTILISLS